jgi:uncharacterized protein YggE
MIPAHLYNRAFTQGNDMPETGILRISETAEADIAAVAARLYLAISGQNFIYGNAALEKCDEVKNLVTALGRSGIDSTSIEVKSVRVSTESGLFTKSSRGKYDLTVQVDDTTKLADVLGIISSAKNVSLDRLQWQFDEEKSILDLSEQAMRKAWAKAQRMVECVGYAVSGIKACSDSRTMPVQAKAIEFDSEAYTLSAAGSMGMPRRARSADIGTEFRGSKEISVTVTVEFFIDKAAA